MIPTVTPKVTSIPTAQPTKAVTPITGKDNEIVALPEAKGESMIDENTGVTYEVTKSHAINGTVAYVEPDIDAKGAITVPAAVTVNGVTYKVTSIKSNAFKGNKKITKVTIGKNVETIGKNAFSGCTKLKTVSMGANVKTISDKVFYNCTALTRITIPSSVKKIGKSAFYGCKKLKIITIKTTKLNKKNVGSNAFKGIYAKATIKVPKSKLNTYKAMLKTKGVGKKVKIKK